MKSCFAGWNPNEFGWNLPPTASDEIKSASLNLAKQDFIAQRFHPRSGFISTQADLTKKTQNCIQSWVFFWCGKRDLNPYGVNHTPLKRARLPVPPLPQSRFSTTQSSYADLIIIHFLYAFVNTFFEKYSIKILTFSFCRGIITKNHNKICHRVGNAEHSFAHR